MSDLRERLETVILFLRIERARMQMGGALDHREPAVAAHIDTLREAIAALAPSAIGEMDQVILIDAMISRHKQELVDALRPMLARAEERCAKEWVPTSVEPSPPGLPQAGTLHHT